MKLLKRALLALVTLIVIVVLIAGGALAIDAFRTRDDTASLTNTTITAADGTTVLAYVARPNSPGTYPSVVMVHEWWGLTTEMIGKAEALADEGYIVVAPDTYRGASTQFIPRAIFLVSTTSQEQVNHDLDTVYQWLTTQPDVQQDKIAIMGFCYGGGKALRYSLTNPNLAATGVFYGDPITDTATLQSLPAPVLGIFGSADQQIPVSEINAFDQALEQADVPHQVTIYEGQPHAFVQSIEEIRAGGAQGEAWAELVAFLAEQLKS